LVILFHCQYNVTRWSIMFICTMVLWTVYLDFKATSTCSFTHTIDVHFTLHALLFTVYTSLFTVRC